MNSPIKKAFRQIPVFSFILVFANLAAWGQSEIPLFMDDFEDGDASDGNPVTWFPEGNFPASVIDGSYVITSTGGGGASVRAQAYFHVFDVSIRTQLRALESTGGESGITVWARGQSNGNSYWAGINTEGTLYVGSGPQLLGYVATSLDPFSTDVALKFDIEGTLLSLTVWQAGGRMPARPQLSKVASIALPPGTIGMAAGDNPASVKVAFRYYEAVQLQAPQPEAREIVFDDGAMHTIGDDTYAVDHIQVRSNTTLRIVEGAVLGGSFTGYAGFDQFTESVRGAITVFDTSKVTIEGGHFGARSENSGSVVALDNAEVDISGGQFTGELGSANGVGRVFAFNSADVQITEGQFGGYPTYSGTVAAYDDASVMVSGGTFGGTGAAGASGTIYLYSRANLAISGGKFGTGPADPGKNFLGSITSYGNNTTTTISGGTFGGMGSVSGAIWIMGASSTALVTISGGTFGGSGEVSGAVLMRDASAARVVIEGGHFGEGTGLNSGIIDVDQAGQIEIKGSSFNLPYGPLTATSATLQGVLANGDPIDVGISRADNPDAVIQIERSLAESVVFDDGNTHVIDDDSYAFAHIEVRNGSTLRLIDGAVIAAPIEPPEEPILRDSIVAIRVFDQSQVIVEGGLFGGDRLDPDSAPAYLDNWYSGSIAAFDDATVTIADGRFGACAFRSGAVAVFDDANLVVSGGTFGSFSAGTSSPDGSFCQAGGGRFELYDQATASISDGALGSTIVAADESTLTISGGVFGSDNAGGGRGRVEAGGFAKISISGGHFGASDVFSGALYAAGYSRIDISGGFFGGTGDSAGRVNVSERGRVDISGGQFEGSLINVDGGYLQINGSSFNVPFDQLEETSAALEGALSNGDAISVELTRADTPNAIIQMVLGVSLRCDVVNGNTLRFTVPTGFVLQSSPAIDQLQWTDVSGEGSVEAPMSGVAGFFRLRSQ